MAAAWAEQPDLIVTSPYLRTRQTAAPTIERFPEVPVEVWPIQEFTYFEPSRWNGTRSAERLPEIRRYWQACDPAYTDGGGAESFAALLRRAEHALARLEAIPENALAYVFSHGQFIQAVRLAALHLGAGDRERMQGFWREDGSPVIANGERVALEHTAADWQLHPRGFRAPQAAAQFQLQADTA